MRAAVLTEYGKLTWQDMPMPQPGLDEVLIRVEYAGICGSDMHVFHGDFKSRTTLPLIPGHEFAGVIADTGPNTTRFSPGDRVTVDPILWCGQCAACRIGHYPACTSLKLIGIDMHGGFGEYVAVPEASVYAVPLSVPARHAALIEVYSIGFHACSRAGLGENDTVVIWGTGRIGRSILQAARIKTKNTIFCVDVLPSRLEKAGLSDPDIVHIDSRNQDPVAVIYELTDGRGADVAFEAVGHAVSVPGRPDPVRCCVQSIRGAGTVCVLGLGDAPAPVLMKELIWKEARIVASRVSHGEFSDAIQNLKDGRLDPESMISAEFPGSGAQKAFGLLEKEPENYIKVLLNFSESG